MRIHHVCERNRFTCELIVRVRIVQEPKIFENLGNLLFFPLFKGFRVGPVSASLLYSKPINSINAINN